MKLTALVILLSFSLKISGQQIIHPSNHYRNGDVLEKKQVSVEGFELNSKNGVWSLEDAEVSKKSFNTEYSTKNDTLMMLERGNRTYFHQENGLVNIIGSENAQEIISYDMPETWLKFPMHQGDSISGYFNGTGKYCDHLFMRRFGTYKTKADAVGKLVLPEGDTLRNVIRLHTERYVGTIVTPIDTIKTVVPVFTVDSIIAHMIPDTARVREDVYRWYAEGYRYPVLEATTLHMGSSALSKEVFYFPPEMQEQLALDEENKRIRKQIADQQAAWNQGDNTSNSAQQPISINDVTVNGQTAVAIFKLAEDADVKGLVCTISGMVLRQQSQHFKAGTNCQMDIDCNSLRKGEYVLYLNANGQVTSRVFVLQ
ncbi:MAG: hypothetical protein E7102_11640 [Prevotella ruminicola]|uniref:Uncharacterized protein n=1 Tax=Xylanibacter ruminicola TaxID=839 RepID=A0A928GID0_XYLRU|nr:hypothetical protein [Xylanibacter ruminicola]